MRNSLQQFKKRALAKPGVHAAYDELAEEFAFLDKVLKAGLTQAEVAERVGHYAVCHRATGISKRETLPATRHTTTLFAGVGVSCGVAVGACFKRIGKETH